MNREFDVVVWGASGFTGRLVAEYLLARHGTAGDIRWALGGRNRTKLEALRKELGHAAGVATEELEVVLGDGDDEASLASLADRTRVVCTTVGPYARYGSKLVAACVKAGTDYCDLTGEVQWMRRMIDAHEATARESGARIVHTCGFDSVPSDLGCHFIQREMHRRHGVYASEVKFAAAAFKGGMSGGTAASMIEMLEESDADPQVARIMADPYALDPEGAGGGPDGPDRTGPAWDADFSQWTAPFVMAAVDTRVVRRTQALLGHPYGRSFRYEESTLMGEGPGGYAKAAAFSAGLGATMGAMSVGPLRRVFTRFLPQPGEGPDAAAREAGFYDIALFARHPSDASKDLRGRVRGDRDPGYGSTAKILGEAAACLAQDELTASGGFTTPAAAMGDALLLRLESHAGVHFTIESD